MASSLKPGCYNLIFIVAASLLGACATEDKTPKEPLSVRDSLGEVSDGSVTENHLADSANAAIGRNANLAQNPDQSSEDEMSDPSTKLPLDMNQDVQRWIEFFTSRDRDRERFQRFLERGERYKPQIMAVLREQGIPTEIYYQAMIESGFTTSAISRAKAVGVWQFMRETGRRYGLRIDSYVDERRDPLRSTVAAALYMKDLYNVFQSWYLAVAAYNAGEGRIMNTIMRSKTRDFWEMARRHVLPTETMNYIPKFIAATMIGNDPSKYGFTDLSPESMPQLAAVAVPAPVRLSDIASVSGIPLALLKDINPNLLRGMTPPDAQTYRIWVPATEQAKFDGFKDRLMALRVKGLKNVAKRDNEKPQMHLVESGDTLPHIASIYGLSVKKIRQLNSLSSPRITPGMRLVLVDQRKSVGSLVEVGRSTEAYRVRSGDSLHSIAKRFGTSIQTLKRLNGLRHNRVATGQVLKIREVKG